MSEPVYGCKSAWITVALATVVMAGALAWGIVGGDLVAEGGVLVRMPWGLVSLIEIYVGITLFGCWVVWREANLARSGAWLIGIALLGNIVSCVYVLLALRGARGNAMQFWMGARPQRGE